ncbi:uncharacterized protein F4822DRAFT_445937 [Hypoxylon trugodes]|uniref:uncharacterized protein n=1 Tax=Hypoxylon trugodes TaxID=326681 RepID=UPI002196C29E|nr:uncharacterized protein F4822DRAFT_445937 [Hypoxylon trugodes]KAI1384574.1 hypothetical protein F4822DRAFT_445937 [Hypoxylon trugodes]
MHRYNLLTNEAEEGDSERPLPNSLLSFRWGLAVSARAHHLLITVGIVAAVSTGFIAGILFPMSVNQLQEDSVSGDTAARIPLPIVEQAFTYSSPFSQEPSKAEGSEVMSEPIWDALIPNGLGYFRDGYIAPQPCIPTVFHQLHCLYILRRAYYSQSDALQEFDFGKNRTRHAAHCFDYLLQSLTCSADSTVEPALGGEHEFLGSGFQRQCRDFTTLKEFVEKWRVFNASGFLAVGLDHGHAHIQSTP